MQRNAVAEEEDSLDLRSRRRLQGRLRRGPGFEVRAFDLFHALPLLLEPLVEGFLFGGPGIGFKVVAAIGDRQVDPAATLASSSATGSRRRARLPRVS